MHFLRLFLLAFLTLAPCAASAQDKNDDAPAKQEKPAKEKAEKAEKEEPGKPQVNWAEVESTGTIGSGKQGGLERTVWKGQKRSEIEFLLSRLPADPALRSVQSLQRRLLLSKTDFGLIENDIGPLRGQDFLIQRIQKLMQMGLYDDAWELYTQKAEDPYDVSIAQQGMILMVARADLATACLEEKVFASRYPDDDFFGVLDKACSKTLGGTAPSTFENSKVLQSVYNDASYNVSASSYEILVKMSDLERALVLANGKISYDGLSRETLRRTPSGIVSLYALDKTIPEGAAAMVRSELRDRGIAPYMRSVIKDDQFKKIRDMKNPDERWPMIESVLMDPARRPADLAPLTGYIADAKPAQLSTGLVIKVLNVLLASNVELSDFWLDAAQKKAAEKPIIYIYLQAFKSLTPTKIPTLDQDAVQNALLGLKRNETDQIIAIIESLDKDAGYDKKILSAYDKHLSLTLENSYVMPSLGLNILLETAPTQKQTGITVLASLNSLAANPDNMYSGAVRKVLYSMLNVGLIEDAKLIGSEIIASVLNKY